MSAAFLIASGLFYLFQTENAVTHAKMMMHNKIIEAQDQIRDVSENRNQVIALRGANTIAKANALAEILDHNPQLADNPDWLADTARDLKVDHIRIFDKDLMVDAVYPPVKNFKPKSFKISKEEYHFGFSKISPDTLDKNCAVFHNVMRDELYKTDLQICLVSFQNRPGGVAVGYKAEYVEHWNENLASMKFVSKGFQLGENGGFLVADGQGKVISAEKKYLMGNSLEKIVGTKNWDHLNSVFQKAKETYKQKGAAYYFENCKDTVFKYKFEGQKKLCNFVFFPLLRSQGNDMYIEMNGKPVSNTENSYVLWYIIGESLPFSEIFSSRNSDFSHMMILYFLTFVIIFFLFSYYIKNQIIAGVVRINRSLEKITAGDLNEEVTVRTCSEFEKLSAGINHTVDSLRKEVTKQMDQIEQELKTAQKIQMAAIPKNFPPFPDREDFDMYARIKLAWEVGGDYYDYILVDDDHLGFTIADISGKGVPAAMFMMHSKVYMRSMAETNLSLPEKIFRMNNYLCDHNEAGMFVTVFIGFVELSTGILTYTNAAHPVPIILPADGGSAYAIDNEKNNEIMLGLVKDNPFIEHKLQLHPGDRILLYTDGITEAENENLELYTQKRLIDVLNRCNTQEKSLQKIVDAVFTSVQAFTGKQRQTDDMTVLIFEYKNSV